MNAPLVMLVVGTDHHPFDRAVRWVDAWAARNPQVRVLVQYGSARPPVHATGRQLIPHRELQELTASALAVVTHGGPASIMEISRRGRYPLVLPRDPALGEHIDGHQMRFARSMAGAGLYLLCDTEQELHARLDAALADPATLDRTGGPDLDVAASVAQVRGFVRSYLPTPPCDIAPHERRTPWTSAR